jgi:hypothetical protein
MEIKIVKMQKVTMLMVPRPSGESVQLCSGAVCTLIFDIDNNHDDIRKQERRSTGNRALYPYCTR